MRNCVSFREDGKGGIKPEFSFIAKNWQKYLFNVEQEGILTLGNFPKLTSAQRKRLPISYSLKPIFAWQTVRNFWLLAMNILAGKFPPQSF